MFQTTNQIVIDVGKTINNPPVITIFIGGIVTIPSIGKNKKPSNSWTNLCWLYSVHQSCLDGRSRGAFSGFRGRLVLVTDSSQCPQEIQQPPGNNETALPPGKHTTSY